MGCYAHAMRYTIIGKVIRGRGYGKRIGFPTANLDRRQFSRLPRKPREGVYAGIATVSRTQMSFRAGIVVGPRDRGGIPRIEAHLLGFTGVLYGEELTLSLRKYLRRFMSFRDEHVLEKRILKDMGRVREIIKLT